MGAAAAYMTYRVAAGCAEAADTAKLAAEAGQSRYSEVVDTAAAAVLAEKAGQAVP